VQVLVQVLADRKYFIEADDYVCSRSNSRVEKHLMRRLLARISGLLRCDSTPRLSLAELAVTT
jgi:hypothetical protein